MSNITLRLLKHTDTDLAAIAAGINAADSEVSRKSFSEQSLKDFLADDQRFYLLAYSGGNIAGAAHGYNLPHPTGVKYLYIDEVDTMVKYRRRGVASAMMNRIFELGREYGAPEVWLGTEHDNEPAKALYLSFNPSEIENGPIYTYKIRADVDK